LWTNSVGIIESFNADEMTAEVQVAIQGQIQDTEGKWTDTTIKILVDCPVQFPSGGGWTLTFPLVKGDECIILFAKNTIDAWWQNGGIQPMGRYRVHDLSDGMVIPGIRSKPRALSNFSTTTTQLRSDDGSVYVELDGSQQITLKSPVKVIVDAPEAHFTGNITCEGDITADGAITGTTEVIGGGKHLSTHIHSGVTTGSGDTGPPV
jgi:hypothetical protein